MKCLKCDSESPVKRYHAVRCMTHEGWMCSVCGWWLERWITGNAFGVPGDTSKTVVRCEWLLAGEREHAS